MAAPKKAAGERAITLHDHIKELRNRFFVVAIVFVAVSALAYNYKDTLIYYLLKPLGDEKLIYLNPAGGFSFIFQVTMYVGVAVAIPFLVFNLYRFVAPALPKSAQKHSFLVMGSSLLLLSIGVTFGYLFAIPGALNFLNHFANGYITPTLTAESYLNFILAYTAGLGILFQLPLVLMFIHWIHPLKPLGLLKFERYMILIAFVAAAMITPTPDIMNQVIMAAPIIIMYQVGFVAICLSVLRAKRKARPSRADRRAAMIAQKKQRKLEKQQKRQPAVPVMAATIPDLPAIPTLSTYATTKPRQPASISTPISKPSVTQSFKTSQRAMDIMAPSTKVKGMSRQIVAPIRPMPLRPSMTIQVPARVTRPIVAGGRMASIDGVSIIY